MDLDALADARRPEWERLGTLARRRSLDGPEVDELVARYQAASADLSAIATNGGRSDLGAWLSVVISRARIRLTGERENALVVVSRFFVWQLPAALYRVRWLTLGVAIAFLIVAALSAFWVLSDPAVETALGPEDQLARYAERDFAAYYTEHPSGVFAGLVWTNNAWIAAQCVMFGVTGLWPAYVIMHNATGLGLAAAIMFAYDRGAEFFLLILPHGLLELTCIFVAGAAGFRVFWAVFVPGPQRRVDAIASAALSMATIALGLVFVLLVAGLLEGFVTAEGLPAWAQVTVGAVALTAFLAYMIVQGWRAVRRGEDGSLTEYEGGTPRLVAA